jgi:anti-sigma B factor antagonist
MEISEKDSDQITVITITGSVDAYNAGQLSDYITSKIDLGEIHIVVDLSQVDFISSAGLRAILGGLKESRRQSGDLFLAAAQGGVENTLRISGFTTILNLYTTVDEAVNVFKDRE